MHAIEHKTKCNEVVWMTRSSLFAAVALIAPADVAVLLSKCLYSFYKQEDRKM
jgi:hypothetical protein